MEASASRHLRIRQRNCAFLTASFFFVFLGCGGGGSFNGGTNGGGGGTPPPGQVTGLTAAPGAGQVTLAWTAVSAATSYSVSRAAASTGPFAPIAAPAANSYADTSVAANTTYYYQVAAVNAGGAGPASSVVAALTWGNQAVQITVDAWADRHLISPLVYGVDFPPSASYIQQSGATFVRWGGNASSRYHWKNFYANSANDWYFQDNGFQALGLGDPNANTGADSVKFVQAVAAAGAAPLMTLPMLNWVAKGGPNDYSFSIAKYGPQCKANPYLADDGDGLLPDCKTPITGNDPNDANVPLLDQPGTADPTGSVYRSEWVQALTPAFGADPHFYDLDNEPDIWNGTHRDVHPDPVTYNELLHDFVTEAANLKQWDPAAVTFGPVSCCWEFYWNSAAGVGDKSAHAGLDFWPWWLNDVVWEGQIKGVPLLNVFDFHAYPEQDTPPQSAAAAQIDAEALASTRGWWDTSFVDQNSWIARTSVTQLQPAPNIQARLIRALAMVNSIAPELPVSVTEWNFGLSQEDPLAVALNDAEGWGLLGRYDLYAAARWTAPDPTKEAPSYAALQLYRNYDGKGHGFDPISVQAVNDSSNNAADPDDCSTYAAENAGGTEMTLLVVNKSPNFVFNATLNLNHFSASQVAGYTISPATSGRIVALPPVPFNGATSFPPSSITLLVLTGQASGVAAEWRLNPGIVMVPASGSVTLHPHIASGVGTVTLTGVQSDAGISGAITQPNVSATQDGAIVFTAGAMPGFYHATVTGKDSGGAVQTKSAIIEVGNPAASLVAASYVPNQPAGSAIQLSVTADPGQSGVAAAGLDLLFTASAGSLAPGAGNTLVDKSADSTRLLETTDANGRATVTLTLPATPGPVTVRAEGPYPIGHPVSTFTVTAQ